MYYTVKVYNFDLQEKTTKNNNNTLRLGAQSVKLLSGSLWLRQPVEDLRFDLGILFWILDSQDAHGPFVRLSFGCL